MLDQLLDIIKNNSQEAVVNNPAVPNQDNEAVQSTLLTSIVQGFQGEAAKGNIGGIMELLSGQQDVNQSPVVSGISQNAIGSLMDKFGISGSTAQSIVSSVLPLVLSTFISKLNNSGDKSLDMSSVLGSLLAGSGANTGGFDFSKVAGAFADGKLDMNDLKNIGGSLLGGNNTAKKEENEGGLGGLLGGLFGGK
ncbi:hypothetical protein [Siphonobacter sp. SORGH_AS_0500]|uniref:hypothetical protein n=1 Tax=Siphonobacter sp. SORGH_AS_0500 TaxID=1864824 RepID=UPI000CC7CBBC|nr:hypothetical protein [Siphonobacter sp. SORGH_AS_0500]MDR6195047.1 uncharacterized protein YidB (DUF937 family) [Siphonobacter sp. SORGH_AS_0500]PKK38416.1 hypothetical protein BWI96_01175 [Siphonobacter sp. SORGH_AS_0500]